MQKTIISRPRILTSALLPLSVAGYFANGAVAAPVARLTVEANRGGTPVSPLLYGIFFEEINRAGDGGIYAEMLQNRSFEDAALAIGWNLLQGSGGTATLDKSAPLNAQNPTSLRFDIDKGALERAGIKGRVGVVNQGFKGAPQRERENIARWMPQFEKAVRESKSGLNLKRGEKYDLSFYARAGNSFTGPLQVSLEGQDSRVLAGRVLASQSVKGLSANWKKYTVSLTPRLSDSDGRLVISAQQTGTIWLDMVSLFPRATWKNRPNGLRADLMQTIAALKPGFVRFPGGCFVEGDTIANAFRWKETVGDIAARPGHWNLWGYRSTDGLGYHEYLQMCEDLGAAPLFVANCGMSHLNGRLNAYAEPMDKMAPWVQDAVDAIEYANGPTTSKWGALRAKNGHPKPFGMTMIQIGNENGGPRYNERFALFHDAIKAKYPQMELVACDWQGLPNSRPLDIIDPHLYADPKTFLGQATRFDSYNRSAPKVYFGEYAVTRQSGTGNLDAALAEAAFMTGLERNGDIVKMSSYAPLLSEIGWKAWNPNAIVYDSSRIYGTPSYHVQALFGANRGDRSFPVQIEQPREQNEVISGQVGVGTWATQAEYKEIQVTQNGQTLLANAERQAGKSAGGTWQTEGGVLRQTSAETGARTVFGDASWSNYTLSLKARKLSGSEGFLILFGLPDSESVSWWNLGGWNNTQHGLEAPGVALQQVRGTIETGRWYDIRVELQGTNIKCFLDGKLVQEANRVKTPSLFAVAGRDDKSGETVLKVVNASAEALETAVDVRILAASSATATASAQPQIGQMLTLSSTNLSDENSFQNPTKIAPRAQAFNFSNSATGSTFSRVFPARSVTVLRFKSSK